jgi:hypothetical protein
LNDIGRQEISRKLSILGFLEERNIRPARSYGGKHVYTCPVHSGDRTPSFYVYEKEGGRQDCFCFGCKFHGDVVALKSKLDSVSISQAFAELAARCGFDPNNQDAVLDDCISMLSERSSSSSVDEDIRCRVVELTSMYRAQRMMGVAGGGWSSRWEAVDMAVRAGDVKAVKDA